MTKDSDERISPDDPEKIGLGATETGGECPRCGNESRAFFILGRAVNILCKSCQDNDERQRDIDAAEEQSKILTAQWMQLAPPEYRKDVDPKLLPDDIARNAFGRAMKWSHTMGKGLILHGGTGRGKTRAAWQIVKRHHFDGIKVSSFDVSSFGYMASKKAMDQNLEEWIEYLSRVRLLFWDDFGQMVFTERVQESVMAIVERRTSRGLPMLITTNDIGDSLARKFNDNRGAMVVRRLREYCYSQSFGNNATKKS